MRTLLIQLVLCAYLLQPLLASAQGRPDPLNYPLKQYGFILAVSILGGFVSWYTRVRKGELQGSNVGQLIGELCTSAFSGLLAFWGCEYMGFPPVLTAGIVGIAGHMGTRGISVLEDVLKLWIERRAQRE